MWSATAFNADAEDYTRTTGGSSATFTWTLWARIDTDRNTFSAVLCQDDAGISNVIIMGTASDGTTMQYYEEESATPTTFAPMTVGVWYFLAFSKTGTGASQTRACAMSILSSTTISCTNLTSGENESMTTMRVGETVFGGQWFSGSVAALKIWSGVALSDEQLLNEAKHFSPQFTNGLHAWYPFTSGSTAGTFDFSGNARPWSGGVATATTDNPPISW